MEDITKHPALGMHGGKREGAGRKKKTEDHDHYTRLAKARADHEEEKALIAEMERRKREGELIEASEVERSFTEAAARVKAKLLAVPGKVAPQLIGVADIGEADAIIKAAIYEALKELKHGST